MSTATVDTQTEGQSDERQICTWKVVLMDSIEGKGTSFDPENLTLSAHRCLWCDGFAGDCLSYTS